MSTSSCNEDFSEDALLNGRVKLLQPRSGYRAAIDPILLAAAIPAKSKQNCVELGLGGGAASLCLLARKPDLGSIAGVELDPDQAALALRNAALNQAGEKLIVIQGDATHPPKSLARNHFDQAFMNPPYLEAHRHDAPADKSKARAHLDTEADLDKWIIQAGKLLKQKGVITIIHRADRLDRILAALTPVFGGIRILPIWPRPGESAKRVIVQAVKSGKAPLTVLPGLALHDGMNYTKEAYAILRNAAPLDLGP